MNKKGISLLMLTITIVVLLILTGVTILNISNAGLIKNSEKTAFKNTAKSYLEELDNWISIEKMKHRGNFNENEVNASKEVAYNGEYLQDIIKNIAEEDIEKYEIVGGRLVYTGNGVEDSEELENETNWAKEAGIYLLDKALGEEDTIVFVDTEENSAYENIKIFGDSSNGTAGLSEITLTVTQNLIDNGFGEYKDTTNFGSNVTNISNEKVKGGVSCFHTNTAGYGSERIVEKISIDTNKKYESSVYLKSDVTGEKILSGFFEYDVDKRTIQAADILYMNNTLTYLTEDLKNGDTVVHLADVSGFIETTLTYQLGFIFWNYTDSTGYTYPPETYSRNCWKNLYTWENVDKTNNTITLNSAWSNGTIKAGTKVSQSNDGADYNYGLYQSTTSSTDWLYRTWNVTGVVVNIQWGNVFRFATKYVSWFIMPNYNNVSGGGVTFANVIFAESDKYNKEYTIDMTGHEPLRTMEDGTSDYIDYKNKRIVRCVGVSGSSLYKLTSETYETIELPTLPIFEVNTAITLNQTGRLEGTYIK